MEVFIFYEGFVYSIITITYYRKLTFVGKWGFEKCWWKLWGLRNRCGYIGRYMDVIDKGFYLVKTNHNFF
jgi:hypothetical protein